MNVVKHVYAYSTASGVEKHRVLRATGETVTLVLGISGRIVRRTELDAPGAWYFTTARKAIESFIGKAEAAIADASRKKHHAGWRGALTEARERLEALS